MEIRKITAPDAESFVDLVQQVERESDYMLFEADERKMSVEQQHQRIEAMEQGGNSTIFVAEQSARLVGYLIAVGGQARKNKHSAYIVIGVVNEQRGRGVGTKLFHQVDEWAKEQSIHRLELTVVAHNTAGIGLYKKMGFEIEGTKRHSLFINDEFVDEYYMAKLLMR